jgi:T5SS/PEP-CTERM-associated repeat protein
LLSRALLVGFCLCALLTLPAFSEVITSGDVMPVFPSNWDERTMAYIHGTLLITEGSEVCDETGFLGVWTDSTGVVTVDGAGSKWTSYGGAIIGHWGRGELHVTRGGEVYSDESVVAFETGSTGLAVVDGAGSKLTIPFLIIAHRGSGVLNILDGGQVITNEDGRFGTWYDSMGEVTVDGAGSVWQLGRSLSIGDLGCGVLHISHGGLVRTELLKIDYGAYDGLSYLEGEEDSYITLASGGRLAISGDATGSLESFLGLIQGNADLRYWDESISDWANITSATAGVDYTLEYVSEGDLAGYTVLTVFPAEPAVLPGDYNEDGCVDLADYTVWADSYGQTGDLPGDGNGDGVVDLADYTIWADHFGQTSAMEE